MKPKDLLIMAIGAILIGLSPIVTKAVTLSPTTIAFYRFFFGTIGMVSYFVVSRFQVDRSGLVKILPFVTLSGFLFGIDLWFWHRSIIYIGAGIATLLANTQIFYLVLIGFFLHKERPRWFFYPALFITFLGLSLVSMPHFSSLSFDIGPLGIIYGLATGVTYALLTFFLRKAQTIYQGRGPLPIMGVTFFAMVTTLALCLMESETLTIKKQSDLIYLLLYGIAIHVIGWIFISRTIAKIPITLTGLILLLQPVFAVFFGFLIYNENLSFPQILGLVLALCGIYFASISRSIHVTK